MNPMNRETASEDTNANGKRSSELPDIPTTMIADNVITPGMDKSIPPVITTSIWPSAARAKKEVKGRTAEKDVRVSVSGAIQSAVRINRPIAIHTDRYLDEITMEVNSEDCAG